MTHEINLPSVVAEVTAAFARYADALVNNKVDVLDELFWGSPHTLRYGAAANLCGVEKIKVFRSSAPSQGFGRVILCMIITPYGADFAKANVKFRLAGSPKMGRQSQTWMRTAQGWRVVVGHVSSLG